MSPKFSGALLLALMSIVMISAPATVRAEEVPEPTTNNVPKKEDKPGAGKPAPTPAPSEPMAIKEWGDALKACDISGSTDLLVRLNRNPDREKLKYAVIHFKKPGSLTRTEGAAGAEWDYYENPVDLDVSGANGLSVHAMSIAKPKAQKPTANCVVALLRFAARTEVEALAKAPAKTGEMNHDKLGAGKPAQAPAAPANKPGNAGGASAANPNANQK